jgi:hypothetical protein
LTQAQKLAEKKAEEVEAAERAERAKGTSVARATKAAYLLNPPSKTFDQQPPPGYKWGREPSSFHPYYLRPNVQAHIIGKMRAGLPMLAQVLPPPEAPPSQELRGGLWNTSHLFLVNGQGILDQVAKFAFDDGVLTALKKSVEAEADKNKRRRGVDDFIMDRGIFEHPLKWLPSKENEAGPSNAPPPPSGHTMYPCLIICPNKASNLKGTNLSMGGKYMSCLLGYHPPTKKSIKEGVHRLVLSLIIGPPPTAPPTEEEGGGSKWILCHLCHSSSCLQPFHMVWGTPLMNKRQELARKEELKQKKKG